MNTLKKTIVSIAFMAISALSGSAQNNTDFNTFVELFPQRSYPLTLSYDDDSVWDVHRPNIPDTLYEKYVFQNKHFIIPEKEKICFDGFSADGKFSTKAYSLLLIGKESYASGCGEEVWLVTYTPQGEIIDVLFVFGRSTNYEGNEERIPFRVESIINADSIVVKREETIDGLIKIDDRTYKSIFKRFDKIYHISEDGKFILTREEVDKYEDYWKRQP